MDEKRAVPVNSILLMGYFYYLNGWAWKYSPFGVRNCFILLYMFIIYGLTLTFKFLRLGVVREFVVFPFVQKKRATRTKAKTASKRKRVKPQ